MRTRTPATNWPAVSAVIAAGIVAAAYVGKLPPAIPQLREEFNLSLVAAGWVNSTFNTLAVTTAIFFGALAARYGALRGCAAGLLALMLGGLLGAAAAGETVLFASRILEGAGFIAIAVSAPALVAAASAPRELNLTLGLWSTYLPLGASLTMLASPFLLGTLGWRAFWLVIVLMTLACAVALTRTQAAFSAARSGSAITCASVIQALRQPGPWWLALGFGCYTLMFYAIMVWLPTFLVQERGATVSAAALLTALVVGVNVGGNLFGTWLVHRAAPRGHVISCAFLVCAAASWGIFSSALSDALRAALCMLLMFAGGIIPAAVLSGSQIYARDASQISGIQGLIVQVAQLGPFFGPPLIAAVVADAGNWTAARWVLLAAATLGTLFGQLAARTERALRCRR
ncbi:MAG: MFS transporter [Burkholderiales bacterium]|nr:MFS transporter [Burkholderiales bacterium]